MTSRWRHINTRLWLAEWDPLSHYYILRDHQRKNLLQEILNLLCSMRGRRILNEHHFGGVVVPTHPRHQNIFQNFKVLHCVDFNTASMKWGGITLPSLAMAAKTITEAGFLLCITGGTSEGSKAIIRVFCLFAASSTTNFFSSTKTQTCPPLCFRWFRSFGHLSALRALGRVFRRVRTLHTYHFIPRSSFTALLLVLRLTLCFCSFQPNKECLGSLSITAGTLSTSLNLTFGTKRGKNSINTRFRIASAVLLLVSETELPARLISHIVVLQANSAII